VCVTVAVMAAAAAGSSRSMRAVVVETPGKPEGMVIAEVSVPKPGPAELLIRIQATAVNRADTLQRKGSYNPPPGVTDVLGLEAAGVVDAVGTECTGPFKVGDRAMVLLAGGGYAEYVSVDERHAMPVPDKLSIVEAAAIPEVWLTAYQLLHLVGKAQPGDTVMIHAGGSGVGTAATQLALLHGCKVLVTAGSEAKRARSLELGASHAFARGDGWAEEVARVTGGAGVNLVLDCVGGSYWKQNAEALGMEGRWVVYGLMGGAAVDGAILGAILRKRLSISGTTLRARTNDYKAELVASFSANALPLFAGSPAKLLPVVDRTFPLEKVVEAHVTMEANANNGKIVLLVDDTAAAEAAAARSEL